MTIRLEDIGKRFGSQWLFRHLTAEFTTNEAIGITGINGSGKSTLIRILAAISLPTEGKLEYSDDGGNPVDLNQLSSRIFLISPYMDLPEQLKLKELFGFQQKISGYRKEVELPEFQQITLLEGKEDRLIGQFSSGMKQRLKLGLAFLSRSEVLFLDEPCSNLDQAGKNLYLKLMDSHSDDRIIFIASNEEATELKHCERKINVMDLK